MELINENSYRISFLSIADIRQSERVNTLHVNALMCKIAKEGRWKTVLPIEQTTKTIMDGNHRYNAALLLGINYLPFIELNYNDPRVKVTSFSKNIPYNIDLLLNDYENEVILPYKTTKHQFFPCLPELDIPIGLLM